MKTTSYGILVCNLDDQLLMCHATGGAYWDIPKGGSEAGETPLQTAIREAAEECALRFTEGDLLELGRLPYRPSKDLHLYGALIERVDTARCRCSTSFRDRFGREHLEMDAFAWVPFADVPGRCAKSLAALIEKALPLAQVAQRLRTRGIVAQPQWVAPDAG